MTDSKNAITFLDRFVLRASNDSILNRQISILAIAENIFVIFLYLTIAQHLNIQWWLYLTALAAPVILLRSRASTEHGLYFVYQFREINAQFVNNVFPEPRGKQRRRPSLALTPLTYLFYLFLFVETCWLLYLFADYWFSNYQDLELLWRTTLYGSCLTISTSFLIVISMHYKVVATNEHSHMSWTGLNRQIFGVWGTPITVFCIITAIVYGYIFGIIAALGIVVGAGFGLSVGLAVVILCTSRLESNGGIFHYLCSLFAFLWLLAWSLILLLGEWVSILFIRITATLHHPIAGLRQLPDNWFKLLLSIDFLHPPEVLPEGEKVKLPTVNSLYSNLDLSSYESRIKTYCIYIPRMIIIYAVGITWRWNLKASLWLWWPIAIALSPPFSDKDIDSIRDTTTLRVHSVSNWVVFLAIAVIFWLLSPGIPQLQSAVSVLPDQIKGMLDALAKHISPPGFGIRQFLLWLAVVFTFLVRYLSYRLSSQHKILFDDETILQTLTENRKELFLRRAKTLQRVHTLRVVAFIFLGYSYLLWIALQNYPYQVSTYVPVWLLGWL